MMNILDAYKNEMYLELENILGYWMQYTIDESNGGFYGKIDQNNKVYPDAPKGSVLNSRILWAFSAAYRCTAKKEYLLIANRAYQYLTDHFLDKEYGGIYWTVDSTGKPLDQKKQIYALSFAIYGFSEYYRCTGLKEAKSFAVELYNAILENSYDKVNGGYLEALARDWQQIEDLRLSVRDANEKKTMNTHLHMLEAFSGLFRVWPDEKLRVRIIELIEIFLTHIIDHNTNHLTLFFDGEWNPRSRIISYGHDIEASWLLQEAADLTGDESLQEKVKACSVKITISATAGLDEDGGLWYEKDVDADHFIKEKHWWPQAEAMVGFFNAWQNTGQENFLDHSLKSWRFIRNHILDKDGGEWFWGVKEDYSVMANEDKAGLWKCCYHNSRACLEIIRRIEGNARVFKQQNFWTLNLEV